MPPRRLLPLALALVALAGCDMLAVESQEKLTALAENVINQEAEEGEYDAEEVEREA
jgi:hypothetical protein